MSQVSQEVLEKIIQRIVEVAQPERIILFGSAARAERLTRFAVFTRYPDIAVPISQEEYAEALGGAGKVVRWVEGLLLGGGEPGPK